MLVLFGTILLSFATPSRAAYPVNQCAADRFARDLGCSAGDVGITNMSVVGDTTSCVGGTNVTLDLQMIVNFNQPSRYDIGIFIANDGKAPEIQSINGGSASCSVSMLPTASPVPEFER